MELSPDTKEVLKFLDSVTNDGLRKHNDIGTILEIGATTGDYELILDILFQGKYLWNLHQTITVSSAGTEGLQKLHEEYKETGLILFARLEELLNSGDEEDKKRFNDIYFAKTAGSFKNLLDLSHDLSKLKEVQTTIKSKS